MTVTAVVCAYWPERFDNVDRIVRDLYDSTVVPETVMVLNNNAEYPHRFDHLRARYPDLRVVHGWNTETRGKYVVALLAYANFYLLCDDDMTLSPRTLEVLTSYGKGDPGLVTSNRGVTLGPQALFSQGAIEDASGATVMRQVDAIHGSCVFIGHSSLVRMFEKEPGLRDKWPTEGDDILVGLANPGHCWLIPLRDDAAFVWLPDGGVALQGQVGYFDMRDEFTKDARAVLGG